MTDRLGHKIVNNEYGNGALIFTNSGSKAAWFRSNIETSQVGVNAAIPAPTLIFSFTGEKKNVAGRGVNT